MSDNSDEKQQESQPDLGEFHDSSGNTRKITGAFIIYKDEREVAVCQTDNGSIVVSTKSWLRENDRKLVEHISAYTPETFTMMFEAMVLSAKYFRLDLDKQIENLHSGENGKINYEYAGRGDPDFSST